LRHRVLGFSKNNIWHDKRHTDTKNRLMKFLLVFKLDKLDIK